MVSIKRAGRDATLIAWGRTVGDCLAVAESWGERGVDVEVLEVGGPVLLDDSGVMASVARTKNAVVVVFVVTGVNGWTSVVWTSTEAAQPINRIAAARPTMVGRTVFFP